MNASPTFNTLADVQAWLRKVSVGDPVALGAANFVPAVARQVFIVLNGSDPLALTATAVAVTDDGATLTGTGIVLDEAGSIATLRFAASAEDPLLVEIEATLPADYRWKPVMGFQFMLGSLVATVSPEPSTATANFGLAGLVLVEGQPPVQARLTLPAVADADWTLAAEGAVPASAALLAALAGGADPLAVIGDGFEPQSFSVSDYSLAFSADGSATFYEIGLGYGERWLPLGSTVFEITDIDLDFQGYAPFRALVPTAAGSGSGAAETSDDWERLSAGDLQALGSATMLLDDTPIEVSVKFPDSVVFGWFDKTAYLTVGKVFDGFHIRLPAGFADVLATMVSFGIHAREQLIDLMVCIDEPVPITESLFFDNFHFDLGIDCGDGVFSAHGDLFARFSFGSGARQTSIAMSGKYDEAGITVLKGSAAGLSIADVIASVAAQFDVDVSVLPKALYALGLKTLTVVFERSRRTLRFAFVCHGTIGIGGDRIQASPTLAVNYDAKAEKWQLKFYRARPERLIHRVRRRRRRRGG